MLLILLTVLCAVICAKGNGNNDMTVVDIEISCPNSEYFNSCSAGVDQDKGFLSLDIIKPLTGDMQVELHVWQKVNGEYSKPTGLDYKQSIEKAMEDHTAMAPVMEALNMTTCPIEPNLYAVENYAMDNAHYPKNIPPGEYVGKMTLSVDDELITALDMFLLITD